MAAGPRIKRICASRNGQVTIFWFPYSGPCPNFRSVQIFARQNQFTAYKLIDSVTVNNQYEYTQLNGSLYVSGSYFLVFNYKCGGLGGAFFSDTATVDMFAPDVINPDSLSVLPNGNVIIGWSPDKAKDTKDYIVYHTVESNNYPVDTLHGRNNNFYVDTKEDGNTGTVRYSLAPTDSCNNVAPIGDYHETMLLSASQDSCKRKVYLDWSPYIGWKKGVAKYLVYMSSDSGNTFKKIDSTAGDILRFAFDTARNFTSYTFFVRAVQNDSTHYTSASNRTSILTQFQKTFNYLYIKSVSSGDSGVRIGWITSNIPEVGYFELWKGRNTGQVVQLARIQGRGVADYSFLDSTVNVNEDVWYYFLKVYNTCGSFSGQSNVSHNIVLRLQKVDTTRYLSWTDYGSWRGGVLEYDVDRNFSIDKVPGWKLLSVNGNKTFSYTDNDTLYKYSKPGVCYRIKAVEGDTDNLGIKAVSFSNTVCYIDEPIVYTPNAFEPEGYINNVFGPSLWNVDSARSSMRIYNRWGELIYDAPLTHGWNGTMKDGGIAPSNMYLYFLDIMGLDRSRHTYKGTLILL